MAYPVPQSDPTSVIGRRILAVLLDGLIVMVPAILAVTAQFEYIEEEDLPIRDGQEYCDQYLDERGGFCLDATDIDDRVYISDGTNPASNVVYWGLNFGLLVLLQGFTGWTPGKLITGIRVVQEDGRPPGFVKALLRWLLWIVDGFPYFIPGLVGFITGLTTPGHRRVGDMAAKTFVVRKEVAGSPVAVPGVTASPTAGVPWGTAPPPPPGSVGTDRGWGTPPDPASSGWASPTPPPPPSASPPSTPVAKEGPQWDEARGTYIQWDPDQRAWMQWDDTTKAWSRMPGQ